MARLVANTANMPEAEWLELRKQGIGGSDASAVAGVNKYASPVMVYMDKMNLYIPDKPDHVKEAARFGHILEPIVREQFKSRVNAERAVKGLKPLRVVHRMALYAHDEHDFIRTNLDGVIYDPDLGKGIFEAKTAHYMLKDDWAGDEVPNAYFIQVQHNMLVMNVKFAWLAVLIGGNMYKHYFIPRDDEMCEYLIQIETAFWNNHILQRIPPQMSGHDAEKDMMRDLYPQSEGREGYITTLPISCIEMAEQVDAYKQLASEIDTEKTRIENEMKAIMGTTETAFAGSHKITWKTSSNGVRPLKIKLDSQEERNKFYAAKRKEIEKERKAIEKELKEIEKVAATKRKADEKARKEAEKAEKLALKEAKKALKEAEKLQKENVEVIN